MPDYGYSKDALRAIIGLSGEFVGTTDSQTITTKTINTTDNTLTATSQAAGDVLINNATKFVRLGIGTAGQAFKVNSGATAPEWGTLPVAGGGTGAATLTGIVKASGTSAMTAVAAPSGAILGDSDVQNISGLKTFTSTTLGLRNPANTFTGTLVNPAVTANVNLELENPYSYLIYLAGSTCKRMNLSTRAVESSGTTHDVVIQAAIDALGNGSGKTIMIKSGLYNLTAKLNFTAINGNCCIKGEFGKVGTQLRPTGDFPAIEISKNQITLDNIWFTHNQSGYTSSMVLVKPATSAGVAAYNILNCGFYDFEWRVGNGIGLDITNGPIAANSIQNTQIYGFANSVYVNLPNSTYWCNSNYMFNVKMAWPKRGLLINGGVGTVFDNNNMFGVEVQGKVGAPNQTLCGFDYDSSYDGRALYTNHFGCMVWDIGSGINYADINTVCDIYMSGCFPGWKIGGSGAASGRIRVEDEYSINRGKSIQSGNAVTTSFNIPHNLQATPTSWTVIPSTSAALGPFYVTATSTNLVVTYPIAPASGSNNLTWTWSANVF